MSTARRHGLLLLVLTFAVSFCLLMMTSPVRAGDPPLSQPSISVSPATVDGGQAAVLSTTSSFSGGVSPYSCQWLEKAPSSTGYTYLGSLFSCTPSDLPTVSTGSLSSGTWNFILQVSDSTPSTVDSSPATVTVNPALGATLVVSPSAMDAGQATTATALVTLSGGTSPYSVTLYSSPSSACSSGSTLASTSGSNPQSGVLGPSATFTFPTPASTTYYCATVTDASTGTPSAVVSSPTETITVNPALVPGGITPAGQTIDSGQSITLDSHPSGGSTPYSFQWYSGTSPTCSSDTTMLGTSSTQAVSPTTKTYYCYRVTDDSYSPVSQFSTTTSVSVSSSLAAGPSTPASPSIDAGQSIVLTAAPSGGTAPYSYQWYSGDFSICSADTTVLGTSQTQEVTPATSTYYCYKVSDGAYSPEHATSAPVEVTVYSALASPQLALSPSALDAGQSAVFSASVSWSGGIRPYSVALYGGPSGNCTLDTTLVATTGPNPDSGLSVQAATLTFSSIGSTTHYCAAVSDGSTVSHSVESNTATITVNAPLSVALSPASPAVDSGQTLTLKATAYYGTPGYSYQWYTGTTCAPADIEPFDTLPTFTTGPLTSLGGYTYSVLVTDDSAGSPKASVCTGLQVTVNPQLTAPTIAPNHVSTYFNQSVTLSAVTLFTGGTAPYSCQWLVKGPAASAFADLGRSSPCSTAFIASASSGALSRVGVYDFELVVTDGSNTPVTVKSPAVTVTVGAAPTPPTIAATLSAIDVGQSTNLTATSFLTGGISPYTCVWLVKGPTASAFAPMGGSFVCSSASLITVSTGPLTKLGVWRFVLAITDAVPATVESANVTVTVNDALAAPAVSPFVGILDSGQSINVTVRWFNGTSPFNIELFDSSTSSCNASSILLATRHHQASSPYTFTGLPALSEDTWYCASVTDGSTVPENVTSSAQGVVVNPPLGMASITVSPGTIEEGYSATLSMTEFPAGGSSPYACVWLFEPPGSSIFSPLRGPFSCKSSPPPSGSTGGLDIAGTWRFEIEVTDSGSPRESAISSAVALSVTSNNLVVHCSSATVRVGGTVKCSARVIGSAPTGEVSWSTTVPGKFSAGTCALSHGKCSVKFSATSASPQAIIIANYTGDAHNLASAGGFILTVTKKVPSMTVSCSPRSAPVESRQISCEVEVKGYSPTGRVLWVQTGGIGKVTVHEGICVLSRGVCSVNMSGTALGTAIVTATYQGDGNNTANSRDAAVSIVLAYPTLLLSCTPSTINVTSSATCTATLTGFGGSVSGETITWSQTSSGGGVSLSSTTCKLSPAGTCSITVTGAVKGQVFLTASYPGDPYNHKTSETVSLTVGS